MSARSRAAPTKTVLIVDGDRSAREAMEEALRKDFSVFLAPDVRSAEDLLRRQAVDLLVLEVSVDQGDGIELLKRLRDTSDVPVLLVSECGTKEIVVAGLRAGASDYLDKPLSDKEFRERVCGLIAQRPRVDHIASRIRRFVQHQYVHDWTVGELAKELHLSVRTMRTVFRRRYRQSVMRFLEEVRVTRACELLVGTDLPIREVAAAVGFPDPHYFRRLFRQHFGKCPRDFRAEHRKVGLHPLLPAT